MKNKLVDKIIEKAGNDGISINKLADDFGISWATMDGIMHGRTVLKPQTKEKLARALGCSVGDINELIRLSDQEGAITKNETTVMGPVKEALDKVVTILAPDEDDTGGYGFDIPDKTETDVVSEVYVESRKDFKEELKDMCLKKLVRLLPGEGNLTEVYAEIGYELVKELVKT